MTRRQLRYKLVCEIGELEMAPSATGPMGYTDDLDVAIWYAERSPYPGWCVYDVLEDRHLGGGPPEEHHVRSAIQTLIGQLTVPGWHKYPYAPVAGDEAGARMRRKAAAEHMEAYPDWRPVSEYVVAPLRQALYRAMGVERAAAEQEPPGPLAAYPDGRDLTAVWRLPEDGFAAWAERRGYSPRLKGEATIASGGHGVAAPRDETPWAFRDRVYAAIPDAFYVEDGSIPGWTSRGAPDGPPPRPTPQPEVDGGNHYG